MPTDSSEGAILTIKEVADFLKVTRKTIYMLAATKKIPAFKVDRAWRFSRRYRLPDQAAGNSDAIR